MSGEWDLLAQYNAERGRGIVHTREWDERMAQEQALFDEAHLPGAESAYVFHPDVTYDYSPPVRRRWGRRSAS